MLGGGDLRDIYVGKEDEKSRAVYWKVRHSTVRVSREWWGGNGFGTGILNACPKDYPHLEQHCSGKSLH
jgi:hypothetical protein